MFLQVAEELILFELALSVSRSDMTGPLSSSSVIPEETPRQNLQPIQRSPVPVKNGLLRAFSGLSDLAMKLDHPARDALKQDVPVVGMKTAQISTFKVIKVDQSLQ
ncbi:hypothetical protein N8I77_001328 [Diaporthe amygdali]|uniref:Uncharacterized protein n=1 Tax=Phomopsis amygdali TaxID=1214568 RepID=A0AAD9SNW8_PHOAM|nr:hypothetical protein N8I77_001328 [Diaporthe amygdali]